MINKSTVGGFSKSRNRKSHHWDEDWLKLFTVHKPGNETVCTYVCFFKHNKIYLFTSPIKSLDGIAEFLFLLDSLFMLKGLSTDISQGGRVK